MYPERKVLQRRMLTSPEMAQNSYVFGYFRSEKLHRHCIKDMSLLDPTSGSGSLLITIGKSAARYMQDTNKIKYYAQELKSNTYNLTRMNLVMRGIKPDNIVTRNGDTLEDDWPFFDEKNPLETYEPVYVDAVVSNPPYSQNWDPSNKENDARFSEYGLAPKGKADYAFLLHELFHLKNDGIMTIVLPHGVLFRGGEEATIRRNLVEKHNIDAIIGLPANIFFGTGIPTIIMVLKKNRENSDILIVDASKGFAKEGKNNVLRACDIKRIKDTVIARQDVPHYARVVSLEEIRKNDYNLNIPRYVDSSEKEENWDIYASIFGGIPKSEVDELQAYWNVFPSLKEALFDDDGTPYVHLKQDNLQELIQNHSDIKNYQNHFHHVFENFPDYLRKELVEQKESVSISSEEDRISDEIFKRLKDVPLVDPYEAYELLDKQWNGISSDLEMIQTEGKDAVRKVDPLMVMKKKQNKDVEVQEGWKGHIIPFELVQKTLLKEESDNLQKKQERLDEISSAYEEEAENLTEDEKEGSYFDDNKFVMKEVSKTIKELKKDTSEDAAALQKKLEKVAALNSEEKALKKQIKTDTEKLTEKTVKIIENLTDEQADELLYQKWIASFVEQINALPGSIIKKLTDSLQHLHDKYQTTLLDIEKETQETEKELSAMIDELTGSEYDMKGLHELQILLTGDHHDERR